METKFLLWGEHHRQNGWVMRDCLGYTSLSVKKKRLQRRNCNRNQPQFVIESVTIED